MLKLQIVSNIRDIGDGTLEAWVKYPGDAEHLIGVVVAQGRKTYKIEKVFPGGASIRVHMKEI